MFRIALLTVLTGIGALGLLASVNSVRFGRLVARDARELTASVAPSVLDHRRLSHLPPPVQRYLAKALGTRTHTISTVRLVHEGRFRTSLDGPWLPIHGEQYFRTDPPAFVWWGRVRLMPGVWVDARDRSIGGAGNMYVSAESTITLADSTGPQLDQGALIRLLGEMSWFPTAFLDERHVRWVPIDDRRARATLTVGSVSVQGEFLFGADDLPAVFSADRYRDTGGGASVLTPFVGRSSDFRPVDGVLVPHRMTAAWIVDGEAADYVDFTVEQMVIDWSEAQR